MMFWYIMYRKKILELYEDYLITACFTVIWKSLQD